MDKREAVNGSNEGKRLKRATRDQLMKYRSAGLTDAHIAEITKLPVGDIQRLLADLEITFHFEDGTSQFGFSTSGDSKQVVDLSVRIGCQHFDRVLGKAGHVPGDE